MEAIGVAILFILAIFFFSGKSRVEEINATIQRERGQEYKAEAAGNPVTGSLVILIIALPLAVLVFLTLLGTTLLPR